MVHETEKEEVELPAAETQMEIFVDSKVIQIQNVEAPPLQATEEVTVSEEADAEVKVEALPDYAPIIKPCPIQSLYDTPKHAPIFSQLTNPIKSQMFDTIVSKIPFTNVAALVPTKSVANNTAFEILEDLAPKFA